MFAGIPEALRIFTHLDAVAYMVMGGLFGYVFGVLPGLGGVQALALLIPFSYGMDPMAAMLMFGATMGAVPCGGSVPAIMINTPGTPQNVATCFDGYPLSQKGKAGVALGASLFASLMGAFVGVFVLIALMPVVKVVILGFGPPEFALLVLMGVIALALLTKGNAIKGLISGGLGFLFAFTGNFPITGQTRFAVGIPYIEDGIKLVPVAVGLFAVAEAIKLSLGRGKSIATIGENLPPPNFAQVLEGMRAVFKYPATFIRSSLIGTLIGIIPALGGTVANILGWTTAAQFSPRGKYFGTGEVEGVVGAESAVNAKDGGALLPTIAFGVPGSAETAILLGAFVLHGMIPGPQLLGPKVSVVWSIIFALVIGNLMASGITFAWSKHIIKITTMRGDMVGAVVFFISLLGAYATRTSIFDTLLSLIFGFMGYLMMRYDFSRPAMVLGLVLGGAFEQNLLQSLMMSDVGFLVFIVRPISAVLLFLILLTFFYVLVLPRLRQSKGGA